MVSGGDGLWNSTNNWSATSGGASGASFPVAGDTVAMDSLSGNAPMTVNVPSACASLIMSGTYAGTFTYNSTLTATSTVTHNTLCTIAGTAGTLINNGTATLTSGGKTLTCGLTILAAATTTMGDNWTVNGLVTLASGFATVNGNQISCAGGLHLNASSLTQGTTKFVLTGGTWDSGAGGSMSNSVDLTAGAGTVIISGGITWGIGGAVLRYVSGTIVTTGSTITANASTLDTAGMSWNNIVLNTTGTITLSSALSGTGTLTFNNTVTVSGAGAITWTGPVVIAAGVTTLTLNNTGGLTTLGAMTLPNNNFTFAGSAGWTVGTFTNTTYTASRTVTLTFGRTYTVTAALNNVGTSGSIIQSLVSGTPGSKVVFKLQVGATCDLVYCSPTDIDSSGGRQIVTSRGTITTSINWVTSASLGGSSVTLARSTAFLIGTNEATGVAVAAGDSVSSNQVDILADDTSVGEFSLYLIITPATSPSRGTVNVTVSDIRANGGAAFTRADGSKIVKVAKAAAAAAKFNLGRYKTGRYTKVDVKNDSDVTVTVVVAYVLEKQS